MEREMMKLLVISLLLSLASTEEGKVTCIAPSTPVEEGKDINLTCHFSFDVSQENVYVYLDPNNGNPERIAWCERPNTETLDCTTEKGYSIEGEVKTSLKLHIMNISVKHNGHVFCQVMPQQNREMPDIEFCSLSVHGMSDLSTTTETATSVNVDGCAGDDESNFGLYFGVGVVVGVVSTCTLVLGIVTSVYCFWYTKRNSRNKSDVENSCFNMDQICACNRRPQEEKTCRDDGEEMTPLLPKGTVQWKSELMLPKRCKGNINDHVPYSDRAELKNHMMYTMENVRHHVPYSDRAELKNLMVYPMENVRQNGGKLRTLPLPKEYTKQNDAESGNPLLSKENVQHHVPYSDLAELNNPMTSMENVQQASEPVLRRRREGNFSVKKRDCLRMERREKPWSSGCSQMS